MLNTDKSDLQVIGGILLLLLLAVEIYVAVDRSRTSYAPLLGLFCVCWIMTPIILYNLTVYKLWFWSVSALEWIALPIITAVCLPEYEQDGTSVHGWVIGGSIAVGVLFAAFSAFMARAVRLGIIGADDGVAGD